MNIIEFVVIISIVIVLLKILHIGFLGIDTFIKVPIAGTEALLVPTWLNRMGFSTLSFISTTTSPLFILILVFYILFYIIYIIIITIVPEFFIVIPLRSLLLKIPPLPDLKKYGVFELFDRIIRAFGLEPFVKKLLGVNNALFIFSRENIKRLLLMVYPDLDTSKLDSNIDDKKRELGEEPKVETPVKERNIIYDKIEENKLMCIANNLREITPDMTAGERMKVQYMNMMERMKCDAGTIGSYIRSNY